MSLDDAIERAKDTLAWSRAKTDQAEAGMRDRETAKIIAEGLPILIRDLLLCRKTTGLAAVTGHVKTYDGEVLITVREDSASAAFRDRVEDITPILNDLEG